VSQLHVHVIARRHSDAAWPKPVWGVKPPSVYGDTQQASLLGSLRQSLEASGLDEVDH
jgi:diadenosine tetraphosphate (Ap4A) HIT family hydrolase